MEICDEEEIIVLDSSSEDEIEELDPEDVEAEVEAELVTISDSSDENDDSESDFDPNETRTKLFINYLPQDLTENELRIMFMDVGPIKHVHIFKNKATDYSYG